MRLLILGGTVRDTLAWADSATCPAVSSGAADWARPAGLAPEREAHVLRAWQAERRTA